MRNCGGELKQYPCGEPYRCGVTADEYLVRVESALPRGLLWMLDQDRVYGRFWRAVAALFAWLHNSFCGVMDELFPCHADDFLERHADLLNYPVGLLGYPSTGTQLCAWVNLINSPCWGNNLWSLRALIGFAGIDYVQSVEEVHRKPFIVGCSKICDRVNSPCCCYIKITLNDAFFKTCQPFRVGGCCGRVCDKLGAYDKRGLDWIVGRYFPVTVPVYISNPAGTQSILLEPQQACYRG